MKPLAVLLTCGVCCWAGTADDLAEDVRSIKLKVAEKFEPGTRIALPPPAGANQTFLARTLLERDSMLKALRAGDKYGVEELQKSGGVVLLTPETPLLVISRREFNQSGLLEQALQFVVSEQADYEKCLAAAGPGSPRTRCSDPGDGYSRLQRLLRASPLAFLLAGVTEVRVIGGPLEGRKGWVNCADLVSDEWVSSIAGPWTSRLRPPRPDPVRVELEVQQKKLVHRTEPTLPYLFRNRTGTVVFDAIIGPDGRVASLRVQSGSSVLSLAAEEAVAEWVYSPTLKDGKPVAVATEIRVEFGKTVEE